MSYVVHREQPTSPPAGPPDHPPGPRRRSRSLLLAVLLAVLAVAIGVFALTQRDGDAGTEADPNTTSPTAEQVEPAAQTLPLGTATAGEGGAAELFGIPIRHQHTRDGATAAAINMSVGGSGPIAVVETAREPLNEYLYTDHAAAEGLTMTSAQAQRARAAAGVDVDGQVISDDGTVDPEATYLDTTLIPEYGAYRVLPGATADRVRVDLWGPLLSGIARPGDRGDAEVHWLMFRITVVWDRGDWRIDDIVVPPELTLAKDAVPAPKDRARLNVSFAERAGLLPASDGWVMVRNAVEDTSAYPEGVAVS
jgi:hypothetical protein